MKVAMVIRRFTTTGGAERYSVEIARRLAEHCELHVFAQELGVELPGVHLHRLSRIAEKPRYLNQMHFAHQVSKLRGGFDVIHSHERVNDFDVLTIHCPTFRGGYLGSETGVVRSWRRITRGFSPRVAYYLWQEARQFKSAPGRRFIAVSRHVMQDVTAHYRLDESDFDFAPPGVDLERFAPAGPAAKAAARARFGCADDELVVAFVGTEFERKGLGALVSAIELLRNERVRLLVAGGGDSRAFERERVQFLGLVSDVQALYAAADIYALPTLSDPAPMAPLEAMASGVPVILSNAQWTGAAEHVQHGEAVLLTDPRNAAELAQAIRSLKDPADRMAYAARGLALARRITWDETARRTLDSYRRSLAERTAVPGSRRAMA
jgi:UDP-glucose:(heptosyl)LPS alpha-1,3-glucosyltransferase